MKTFSEITEQHYEDCFRDLLRQSGDQLELHVKHAAESDHGRVDFQVTLRGPAFDNPVKFLIETNPQPRPGQFPFVEHGKRVREGNAGEMVIPVLAAPFISERIAELCKEHEWSWFDLSGNCRIKVPNALYVERTGFKAEFKQPRPLANLSTAASGRVLRALLAPQNAGRSWTQTDLKKHCEDHESGVSFGLINKVVHHLKDQAWVEDVDDRFVVRDPVGLLETWGNVYRFDKHRRASYFTLLKPRELHERLELLNSAAGETYYAAFSAADFQAPMVRQNKTWLYVNKEALEAFVSQTEAKQVDSGENLVVIVPDDDGVFYLGDAGNGGRLACTNPVQTWLDLRQVGNRGEEAAEAILKKCLMPQWKGLHNA